MSVPDPQPPAEPGDRSGAAGRPSRPGTGPRREPARGAAGQWLPPLAAPESFGAHGLPPASRPPQERGPARLAPDGRAADSVARDAAEPERVAADGLVAEGVALARLAPDAVAPGGVAPGGVASERVAPGGAVPGGLVPGGLVPGGLAPSSAGQALDLVLAGLGWLAAADLASIPAAVQADCLRGLERAQSVHAAARAKALSAFCAQGGYETDGQGSPRTWLTWQTKITRPAASAALASARTLAEHPGVAGALAAGAISVSWARQITAWTDLLPADVRADADTILLAAAAGGADLDALAELAEQIRARTAKPDRDGDGFEDRALRLGTTLGGAGRLHGDLTPAPPPRCSRSWTASAPGKAPPTSAPPPSASTTPSKKPAPG